MSGFTVGVIYEQVECRVQCRVESRVECRAYFTVVLYIYIYFRRQQQTEVHCQSQLLSC